MTPKGDAPETNVPGMEEIEHDELHPVLKALGKYWKPITAVVVALLVVLAGVALYKAQKKSRIADVQAKVGKVLAETKGADRLAGLEKILADGAGEAQDGVLLEIAKTALDEKDYAKAASAWEKVASVSGPDMRAAAMLGRASALSQSGDNAKAAAVLTKLEGEMPDAYSSIVYKQLAVAAEAAGDTEKAIQAYEKLQAESTVRNKTYFEAKIEELKAKSGKDDAPKS